MKYISTIGMSKKEWLEERKLGIGGSDVGAICQVNPFSSRLDVWREKTEEGLTEIPDNKFMYWGRKGEQNIAERFAEDSGLKVEKSNKIYSHDDLPHMKGNVDRLILGHERGVGILECKTTDKFAFKYWEEDGVPKMYEYQLQHYLFVTGYEWGVIAVLAGGNDYHEYLYEFDGLVAGANATACSDFWFNYVTTKTQPEPLTAEDLGKVFPVHEPGKLIDPSDITIGVIEEYKKYREEEKLAKEKKEKIKLQLLRVLGDAEGIGVEGQLLCTYKNPKARMRFDEKGFKDMYPDLHSEHSKEVLGGRRMNVR